MHVNGLTNAPQTNTALYHIHAAEEGTKGVGLGFPEPLGGGSLFGDVPGRGKDHYVTALKWSQSCFIIKMANHWPHCRQAVCWISPSEFIPYI